MLDTPLVSAHTRLRTVELGAVSPCISLRSLVSGDLGGGKMADLADTFRSDYMSHTCKIISLCSTSFDLRVSMFFKT